MNRDEMLNFLKNEARGISVMFGPNCETIVHDMTRPGHPILAIFNGTVTGREVGSTADIFGDIGDYDESIYQNKDYINQMVLSRDGRTLKSSTFNIVGEDYHFALGINLDITNMVRAGQMLSELTATSGDLQQTLMQDARSQLEELLRECISAVGKEPEAMKKTDRMRIIRMLYKRRAFTYQKSVAIVAERYTSICTSWRRPRRRGALCRIKDNNSAALPGCFGLYRKSRQAQNFLLASVYSKRVNLNIPSDDLVHSFSLYLPRNRFNVSKRGKTPNPFLRGISIPQRHCPV